MRCYSRWVQRDAFGYGENEGGAGNTADMIVEAARAEGVMLDRAFVAVRAGRAAADKGFSMHMSTFCIEVLGAVSPESEWEVATVLEGGPPEAVVIHAMPDVDVTYDLPGHGLTWMPREEQPGEMILQVVEWVIENCGRPFKVPGLREVEKEEAAVEVMRIGKGGGRGLQKVAVRWGIYWIAFKCREHITGFLY